MQSKVGIAIIGTALLAGGGIALDQLGDTRSVDTVREQLEGKNARERANIKGTEIAKLPPIARTARKGYEVEVVSLNAIEGGVAVFVRAWKGGQSVGFGRDGSVEIERVRIMDPDILVPDPNGDIVFQEENLVTGKIEEFRYREDLKEALLINVMHAVRRKEPTGRVIPGKIGNTTTIQPPSADTWMRSSEPNSNNDTHAHLWQGEADSGTGEDAIRNLLKFDISGNLPAGDTVTSATLSLFNNLEAGILAGDTSNVYRVLRDWVSSEATWNIYSTGNSWQTAGVDGANDRSATLSASAELPTAATNDFVDWTSAQLAQDVQDMLDGSVSNFGWTMQAPEAEGMTSGSRFSRFSSANNASTANRPKLVVEHEAGGGDPEPEATTTPRSALHGDTAITGNAVIQ